MAPFEYSKKEQQRIARGEKVFPHIMGTDNLGRDYCIRVIYGTRISLMVGLISALIASAIVCGGYYAVYEWYGKNPTNLTAMFGGTLLPLQDLWYYVVLGFMLFGFVLCGIGTATSIRKHLQV